MINVELGKEKSVRDALSHEESIRKLLYLFGEYDFIAIIETDTLGSLNKIVERIRGIDGIKATKTIIGAEF
ncbi:MAG: Lrp/AsnC ligand binding domain-containing protein [Candidatus Hydrothermarchaeaceae archaeon]